MSSRALFEKCFDNTSLAHSTIHEAEVTELHESTATTEAARGTGAHKGEAHRRTKIKLSEVQVRRHFFTLLL